MMIRQLTKRRYFKHKARPTFLLAGLIGFLVLSGSLFQEFRTPIIQKSATAEIDELSRRALPKDRLIHSSDTLAVADPATKTRLSEAYGKLPLSFEVNQGQVDGEVRFLARGSGYNFFLTPTEAVLAVRPSSKTEPLSSADLVETNIKPPQPQVLRMKLVGARPSPEITGVDEQSGKSNYFLGDDPRKWRTNVAHYARVQYASVYPGVSLVYYGNQRELEYDFVLNPGIDPDVIKLSYEGVRNLRIDKDGDLILLTKDSEFRQHRLSIYQETDGERKAIAGRYKIRADREIGFELDAYDKTKPVVIDPVLAYSTYLGGEGSDVGYDIAVDSLGDAYVAGATRSVNFPTVNSLPYGDRDGSFEDVFVTKLNAAGSALVYSTYLGGTGGGRDDRALAIAVDSSGNAYVTGSTTSSTFPSINPLQSVLRGGRDAFVTKLNSTGSALVYSTFLGGSEGNEEARGIAVDSSGGAYVTGYTRSTDFPMVNALYPSFGGLDDGFVAKLNPAGSALVYSTYLGGGHYDYGNSVAVDSSGSAYITGLTYSNNFPLANPLKATCGCFTGTCAGDGDVFVTKLNPAGSALVYSTYLGGSSVEEGRDIAVDSSGNAYITGNTGSNDFPTVNPVQPTLAGGSAFCNSSDAFVTKLNSTGSALVYSTFLGGFQGDGASSIAVDSAGSAYVTGNTIAGNFPTLNPFQPTIGGAEDAFVAKLNPAGAGLVFSTYLGGSNSDVGNGIGVDSAGNAYVTGSTTGNFPTQNPFQPVFGGGNFNANQSLDAFVAKIGDSSLPPAGLSISAVTPNRGGNTGSVSVTIHGSAFTNGATVKLVSSGKPDITAVSVGVSEDRTVARARFDLLGQVAGVRDVLVTNPGGASVMLAGSFTLETGGSPQVWIDIIGRDEFRPGRPQTYYIAFGNRGNIDAALVPIFIAIPKEAQYELGFNLLNPSQPVTGQPFDFSQIPAHYETATEKVIPLLVGFVPAGSADFLKIRITGGSQPLHLITRVHTPTILFSIAAQGPSHSSLRDSHAADRYVSESVFGLGECFDTIATRSVSCGLGFLPGEGCAAELRRYGALVISNTVTSGVDAVNGSFTPSAGVVSITQVTAGQVVLAGQCGLGLTPVVGQVVAGINCGLGGFDIVHSCVGFDILGEASKLLRVVFSIDPNSKIGSEGVGDGHYVSGEEPLRYSVYFENLESATVPAQDVVITDQLDPAKLDFDTFSLGPIGFGVDKQVVPPSGLSEFKKDVDLRPAKNLIVRVEAKLNKTTGLLTWRFTSLDPATGLPTEDPTAGFLPPNQTAPEGEGQVLFTVRPKEGVAVGTEIRNKARIVFDTNAPLDTPEWLNTIDYSKPVSQVLTLPVRSNSAHFEVRWSGSDTGSGVKSYTIFVSENGGAFVEWLHDTTSTSGIYNGRPGHAYAFYSVARDATSNLEEAPATADATITTDPLILQFSVASYSVQENAGNVQISVSRSGNTSDAAAVDFYTVDDESVPCNIANGRASSRCDYATSTGTLRFATGETMKTLSVAIIDDGYLEGNETFAISLRNPGDAMLGPIGSATITILDNDTAGTANPIFNSQFFVRQHYLDFLSREPNQSGWDFWTNNIESCGSAIGCRDVKRIDTSAAFFLSIEFQNTGYLVYRTYKAAFGNITGKPVPIRLAEFLPNTRQLGKNVIVGAAGWEAQLEANKQAYFDKFVAESRFATAYTPAMTAAQYVDALNQNAGGVLSQAERNALVASLSSGAETRATVLRKIAENSILERQEFNRAFVLMQYFGYLRRDPDTLPDSNFSGYNFWLTKLDNFGGDFRAAEMVKAFISSGEYLGRFGN